jgi:limonene-1,2-epoxide hydrolase
VGIRAEAFEDAAQVADAAGRAAIDVVRRFFDAVGDMDFERAASSMADGGVYHDSPVPDRDACGPEAVRAKLAFAIEGLKRFDLRISKVAASGDVVMSERVEDWHFPTGEVASLPVMCVHEVRNGKITAWREYWDMQTLMSQMPQAWLESYANR